MLRASTTITSSGGGPGTYTATVLFSDAALAPFVRVNDTLEDKDGFQYRIITWAGFPSDFSSGGTMTVYYLSTDQAPATFGGFGNAAVFTPAQVDVRPLTQSGGLINTQALNSGQNSLYDITCSWFDPSANNVQPGDHIMDASGKVYEITVTDGGANNITAKEVTLEGASPILGAATLFTPTVNVQLFQGTPVSDPARTVARNKDDFNIDAKLKELEDSISAGASAGEVITSNYENTTGSVINPLVAVATDISGDLKVINVTLEDDVQAFKGISSETIPDGSSGQVAKLGLIQDITTAFAFQDSLYISKNGTLTNVVPEIGGNGFVAGDFVFYVGHIARNETNPTQKDLDLRPQLIGQL